MKAWQLLVGTLAVLCGMTWSLAAGEKDGPATKAAAPANPDLVRVTLMDGSTITGKLSIQQLDIETKFGPLHVPVTEVRRLVPGLDSHPDQLQKIADMIKDLGSEGFPEREAAQQGLTKLGSLVRGELEAAVKAADGEQRTRLLALMDEIDNGGDEDEVREQWKRQDLLETAGFTIVGKLTTKGFEFTSPYGPLNLKINDVRRVEKLVEEIEEVHRTLTVSGTQFAGIKMANCPIRVEKGDQVTITATGTITMTPWGNNARSTPDGAANYGWYMPNQIATGALVVQVGKTEPIKAGTKCTFTAEHPGALSFGVGMIPEYTGGNYSFPGEYSVKVKVVRKK